MNSNFKIIKHLTLKQLINIHNNNEKCVQLFGKNLSETKNELCKRIFEIKPQLFS